MQYYIQVSLLVIRTKKKATKHENTEALSRSHFGIKKMHQIPIFCLPFNLWYLSYFKDVAQ